MKYRVKIVGPRKTHCGDMLCVLSACREHIRRTGNTICVDEFGDVVKAYHDPKFLVGGDGVWWSIPAFSICAAHRIKDTKTDAWKKYHNIYGTFLGGMGLLTEECPLLDFPRFDNCEPKVVIQPFSRFAKNPPLDYLQFIVDCFHEMTDLQIYAIGHANTPQNLRGVNYSLLETSVPRIMQIVQHSIFVLSPRSLAANIAAAYNKPAFVWAPNDGENWHLNYEGWDKHLYIFEKNHSVKEEIENFLGTRVLKP